MSYAYRDDAATDTANYDRWLDELIPLLPAGAAVLDLGCGCGVPVTKRLAGAFVITGVDVSPLPIERARRLVPSARLLCDDMGAVDFEPASFGAIVSFFALIHVPVEEQAAIIQRLGQWLRPGGYFMATVGAGAWTGMEESGTGRRCTGATPTVTPICAGSRTAASACCGIGSSLREPAAIPSCWPSIHRQESSIQLAHGQSSC